MCILCRTIDKNKCNCNLICSQTKNVLYYEYCVGNNVMYDTTCLKQINHVCRVYVCLSFYCNVNNVWVICVHICQCNYKYHYRFEGYLFLYNY